MNEKNSKNSEKQNENTEDQDSPQDYQTFYTDQLSTSDSKLGEILTLAKNSNKDIETILEENQDYIRHVFGYCECYTCTCGSCKCKFANNPNPFRIRYQNGMHSVYTKDYQPQDNLNMNDLYLEQTAYPTNFRREPMKNEYQSCNQQLMKGHKVKEVTKRFFPREKIKDEPLFSLSTYQNQFVNWYGTQTPDQKFPERKQAIHEMPFYANTTYKDSYDPRTTKYKVPELDNLPHKGPIPQYLPFQQISEAQQKYVQYQPKEKYQIYKQPKIQYRKSDEFQPYGGTFVSKTQQDFAKRKDPICNAKIIGKIPFDIIKHKVYGYMQQRSDKK